MQYGNNNNGRGPGGGGGGGGPGGNNNGRGNNNVFGVPAHLTNGYAFHNAGNIPSLDPHAGSAVAAAHAAQWNQQAAVAQQQKLYDQYNNGPNNI